MHKRWGVRRIFKGQKMYIYQLHNCSMAVETVPLLCGVVCANKWGIVFADNGFGEFISVPLEQTVFSIVGAYAGEY